MANQQIPTTRRQLSHPSDEMVAWIKLAATYERSALGDSITPQTERALQQMVTFLTQPAHVYNDSPKDS